MIWSKCLKRLQSEVSAQEIDIWLRPLKVIEELNSINIIAPNDIIMDRINDNYLKLLKLALNDISDIDYEITVSYPISPFTQNNHNQKKSDGFPSLPSNIDKTFTFDNFVEGSSNSLAMASAIRVAQDASTDYNPLLIYGSTGLGKTHLLHAIGNKIKEINPQAVVCYVHSEQFVNNMISAIRNNSIDKFKEQYRSVDALLIDDIQFFAGKDRTQEEFFHTFNHLLEYKQRVIITCDRFPKEVNGLESRLKSRLGWGVILSIDPPEFETRVAILQKKALQQGIVLADNIAHYIADKIKSNIRELEGALKTLLASASLRHVDIDLDFTKETLKELFNVHQKQISVDNIITQTANYYNIKKSDLLSKKRVRSIARPRQMAMFLSKELTDKSLPEIGEAFGGKDHTTVIYACRKIKELMDENSDWIEDKQKLINLLTI